MTCKKSLTELFTKPVFTNVMREGDNSKASAVFSNRAEKSYKEPNRHVKKLQWTRYTRLNYRERTTVCIATTQPIILKHRNTRKYSENVFKDRVRKHITILHQSFLALLACIYLFCKLQDVYSWLIWFDIIPACFEGAMQTRFRYADSNINSVLFCSTASVLFSTKYLRFTQCRATFDGAYI